MTGLEISELMLYFGDDYVINNQIKIHQPLVGELIECEQEYLSTLHTIVAVPSDMKSQLWDIGLDWCELEDFELFTMLAPTLTPDRTSLLFGDLDFSKLRPYRSNQNDDIYLADIETGIKIDQMIYLKIVNYLRKLHNITPKHEKTKSKVVKKWLIEEDRRKISANQNKPFKSYLMPLISSVKVKQGYTREYVRNMGLCELFDDIARLQIINNADHLLHSVYGGNIDMKKLDKSELNWMREL